MLYKPSIHSKYFEILLCSIFILNVFVLGSTYMTTSGPIICNNNEYNDLCLGIPYASTELWQDPKAPLTWDTPQFMTNPIVCPSSDLELEFAWSFPSKNNVKTSVNCTTLSIVIPKLPFFPQDVSSNNITSSPSPTYTSSTSSSSSTSSPSLSSSSSSTPQFALPVLVYFHPGNFHEGNGQISGLLFNRYTDMIIVIIESRHGILGYYTDISMNITGNYGLKDQLFALEWVYNNIQNFYGDKHSITLMGTESGGYNIALLSAMPEARKFFHRVILNSVPWGIPPLNNHTILQMIDNTKILADCTSYDCFLQKYKNNPNFLIDIQRRQIQSIMFSSLPITLYNTWRPYHDGVFVKKPLLYSIWEGDYIITNDTKPSITSSCDVDNNNIMLQEEQNIDEMATTKIKTTQQFQMILGHVALESTLHTTWYYKQATDITTDELLNILSSQWNSTQIGQDIFDEFSAEENADKKYNNQVYTNNSSINNKNYNNINNNTKINNNQFLSIFETILNYINPNNINTNNNNSTFTNNNISITDTSSEFNLKILDNILNSYIYSYPLQNISYSLIGTAEQYQQNNLKNNKNDVSTSPLSMYVFNLTYCDFRNHFALCVDNQSPQLYDIPTFFPSYEDCHDSLTFSQLKLQLNIHKYFANFVSTGNPSQGPYAPSLPTWTSFDYYYQSLNIQSIDNIFMIPMLIAHDKFWKKIGLDNPNVNPYKYSSILYNDNLSHMLDDNLNEYSYISDIIDEALNNY